MEELRRFTPGMLDVRRLGISPQTQAHVARAERALVRMEGKALGGHISGSLRRILTRLEAVSTIRIEGKAPRLMTLLQLEACALDPDEVPRPLEEAFDFLDFEGEEDRQIAVEVLCFERALDHIYRCFGTSAPITAKDLLDIHSLARYGCSAEASGVGFRASPWSLDDEAAAPQVYEPPAPEDVPALVDDVLAFANSESFSPIARSAIAHFQFESVKPFKSGMDKTGRLMCHAILHRSGLMDDIVAPIGLEPAIDTASHARSLLPYNFGLALDESNLPAFVDQWTTFCALSAEVAARAADVHLDAVIQLKESWLEDFGRPNKGSALEALLDLLPGTPVLTVRQAAAMTGKSLSAVNDALSRLERAGIVKTVDRFQRGRLLVAGRAVGMLEEIGRHVMPRLPVDRDSLA